jgi:outer membrane protein assembly factor BamA
MTKQQERLQALSEKLSQYVQNFPIRLGFPANVYGIKPSSQIQQQQQTTTTAEDIGNEEPNYTKDNVPLRTSSDFINYRLLDTGIDFISGDPTSLSTLTESLQDFVKDLENTGCYESVQVILGRQQRKEYPSTSSSTSSKLTRELDVVLQEKNWYKLYIGGGIKQDYHQACSASSSGMGMIPKMQFETSASLINLTGETDVTQLYYSLDQTSTPSLSLQHTRPLYSLLSGSWGDAVLNMDQGSKIGVTLKASVDTHDYDSFRSSKDHVQKVSIKVSNNTVGSSTSGPMPGNDGVYTGLEWSLAFRDVIPRRHGTVPFQYDASPEIIAASGPNLKHSLVADYRLNGYLTDDRFNPTAGFDAYGGVEVAGPPGDVGFVKLWGGASVHVPIVAEQLDSDERKRLGFLKQIFNGLSLHTSIHGGSIKGLDFGGLCCSGTGRHVTTNISDRFHVGGSHQLRGFLPSGIGPRSVVGGASTPGGDSMGGDVFYTASALLSMPFPGNEFLAKNGVRLFAFANAGTLTSLENAFSNIGSFVNSSRTAVGGGVSVGTAIGRLEATYAVPLRYAPSDARRSVQAGIGFTFG